MDSISMIQGKQNVPGTKSNQQTNELLISSGIAALDELLGGGIPVGSIVFIEEDRHGLYAKVLLKYFLAEGIVSNQSTLIASQDMSTETIVHELPEMIFSDPEPFNSTTPTDQKMKIAFRYQNLPSAEKRMQHFGHYFDLSKTMPQKVIEKAEIIHWNGQPITNDLSSFLNPAYYNLLQCVQKTINEKNLLLSDNPPRSRILRIGLHALGSPMWLNDNPTLDQNRDLSTFIFCLRSLLQSALSVAFITVPSFLLDQVCIDRCIHSSDIAIHLQAFAGTELENNPILSQYHGYFHLVKLAARNSLASKHPGSIEYTFKLKRKKLCIEKLHLPPDLGDSDNSKTPTMSCVGPNKELLEF